MSVQTRINEALTDFQRDLVANYDKLGLRASGNWAKELENFYSENDNGYQFGILGASYTDILQNGRLPNKKQTKESLKAWVGWAGSTFLADWVEQKGLSVSPFAVAWKIAREGVKVPNSFNKGGLVSDVINDESIQKFTDIVKFSYIDTLRSEVKNILSNGNN